MSIFLETLSLMLQTLSAGGQDHISSSEVFSSGICGFETTKSRCSSRPSQPGQEAANPNRARPDVLQAEDSIEELVTEAPVTCDSS